MIIRSFILTTDPLDCFRPEWTERLRLLRPVRECVLNHLPHVIIGEAVVDVASVPAVRHEAGVTKHAQLVAHSGLADFQRVHDFMHTHFPPPKQAQDAEPRPIGKALEELHCGSKHAFVGKVIRQGRIAVAVGLSRGP